MRLAVIGLGKLGLCTAACFAKTGHQVWGFDKDPHIMESLRKGQIPIREPDLAHTLEQAGDNLHLAHSLDEAVEKAQVSMIIVPTPSLPEGGFDNTLVEKVLLEMGPSLKAKEEFHVVDVVSTVSPGSSQRAFIPLLEKASDKKCGQGFGLVYNPEFIALGSVIKNFLNPDLVLIGASDDRSGGMVSRIYENTCPNAGKIALMSLINAEITKLSLNCYVTMKISFANELAGICEKIPGADVDVVTNALGADTRIGQRCLKGGMGFGGPCFPRDNLAFAAFAKQAGKEPRLSPQVVQVNKEVVQRLCQLITANLGKGSKVAVLGLSYKPGTHIVEESQSIELAEMLLANGYEVSLHDPLALSQAKLRLNGKADYAQDPYQAASKAGAVALLTDWPEYQSLNWSRMAQNTGPGALLLDAWRILSQNPPEGFIYQAVGQGAKNQPLPKG